jgi:hypothetical protein
MIGVQRSALPILGGGGTIVTLGDRVQLMYESNFPITERDPALDRAMDIAMGSMRQSGMADHFANPEALASSEILKAWNKGMRHPVALANKAIVAAERLSFALASGFPQLM